MDFEILRCLTMAVIFTSGITMASVAACENKADEWNMFVVAFWSGPA